MRGSRGRKNFFKNYVTLFDFKRIKNEKKNKTPEGEVNYDKEMFKMANREENLKKINGELNKLRDEELEQVAGGDFGETSSDSRLLYEHGLMNDWQNIFQVILHWVPYSKEVDEGWSRAGITCVTKPLGYNKYFAGSREITRDEAINIVKSKFKKVRQIKESFKIISI